jgi:hypothetical protein
MDLVSGAVWLLVRETAVTGPVPTLTTALLM